jgi:hypothetical protein
MSTMVVLHSKGVTEESKLVKWIHAISPALILLWLTCCNEYMPLLLSQIVLPLL